MELSAEIFRTRGRSARAISAEVIRELDSTDLVLLQSEKGSKPTGIKALRERHHALARNIAAGMADGEAAILQGYSISRVSILKGDPAFKELLEFYRADAQRPYRDLHARLAGMSADAADLLQEKIEADSELEVDDRKLSVGQLMEITKMGADRTGFGPQATNLNVNMDMSGRLEAARKRVALRKLTVIEGGKEGDG